MTELQQAKEGLLIHLQANSQFIQQKLYNDFNVECIQLQKINKLNLDKMQKAIKQIFDFGTNKCYEYFFNQIKNNIKNYIKKAYQTKAIDSFYVLDIQKLVDIVNYCINNGFNQEDIQKEKEKLKQDQQKKKAKEAEELKRLKQAQQKKSREYLLQKAQVKAPPKDQFAYVKPRISSHLDKDKIPPKKQFVIEKHAMPDINTGPRISTHLEKDKIPPKKQFVLEKYVMPDVNTGPRISSHLDKDKIPVKKQFVIQKFTMPDKNVLPRYLLNTKTPLPPKIQEQAPVYVAPLQKDYLLAHKKVLRERLEKIFNFYCDQQYNIGNSATFDRIKSNGQKMTLGKFMQFCQFTKLFNCKQMTKDMLMMEFKKIIQGKLQMPFDIFQKLIVKLDEKYIDFMKKDSKNSDLIASYEARLYLNEPDKIKQVKKHRHLIFGTKDLEGRQQKAKSLSVRYKNRELTSHSGIFSNDLSLLLKNKNQQSIDTQKYKHSTINDDSYIKLSQLKKLKLPKLDWITEQQTDERQLLKLSNR